MWYWLAFAFAQFDACIQDLVRCVALTKLVFGARHLKLAQAHIRLAKAYLKFKGNHNNYRENQLASVWSRANRLQTLYFTLIYCYNSLWMWCISTLSPAFPQAVVCRRRNMRHWPESCCLPAAAHRQKSWSFFWPYTSLMERHPWWLLNILMAYVLHSDMRTLMGFESCKYPWPPLFNWWGGRVIFSGVRKACWRAPSARWDQPGGQDKNHTGGVQWPLQVQ